MGWSISWKRLTDAIQVHKTGQKDPEEEEWDEHDYEKFFEECDARNDKYAELLDKYGHSEEAREKIDNEMGWDGEVDEQEQKQMDEMNAICEAAMDEPLPEPDPAREGTDWIRTDDGDVHHPLQHRCFGRAVKYWKEVDKLGLRDSEDKDLVDFISEFQTTGAKLAGALGDVARGEHLSDPAFTVAYLKRALDHVHKSQAGLEAVAPKKLLPEKMVAEARKGLFEIREGILRLMAEFRGRK